MEGRCCEIGEVCGWIERLVIGAFLGGPSISMPDSMSSALRSHLLLIRTRSLSGS